MTNLIIEAARFATEAHQAQVRKWTGRPFIEHPARVAGRVMTLPRVEEFVVCAAWLHDVKEDRPDLTIPDIFPQQCLSLVDELTNPSKIYPELPRAQRKAIDREHFKWVSSWAKVVKLIDRIDNVRDLKLAPADFVSLYLNESLLLCDALDGWKAELQFLEHVSTLQEELRAEIAKVSACVTEVVD